MLFGKRKRIEELKKELKNLDQDANLYDEVLKEIGRYEPGKWTGRIILKGLYAKTIQELMDLGVEVVPVEVG